jgi:replicative DNA helicase
LIETPPALCNMEAEHAVIGMILYDNAAMTALSGTIEPRHFYEPFHQRLFAVAQEINGRGQLVEPTLIASRFLQDEAFEELGGMRYLAEMIDVAPPTFHAPSYARAIIDMSLRRELVKACQEAIQNATHGLSLEAFDHVAEADKAITALLHGCAPDGQTLVDAKSSAFSTLDEIELEAKEGRAKGAMTGLRCFDRRMRGLRPGWLVVLAGRPSMGKTALARAAAYGCAKRNPSKKVLFFALEMSRRELDERTLSQIAFEHNDMIAYKDMSGDTLNREEMDRLRSYAHEAPDNFIMDDSTVLSMSYVRRRVLSVRRKGPIAAIFVDYLQIMDRPDAKGRNEASVIGEMTKQFKQLAREANCCVVLLSQINRGVENRDDKRPQLSDLRESGAIEQDANAVLFPYREVYYKERSPPTEDARKAEHQDQVEAIRRDMDVHAAKVRGGAIGVDKQIYWAEYDAIYDKPEDDRR